MLTNMSLYPNKIGNVNSVFTVFRANLGLDVSKVIMMLMTSIGSMF